MPQMAPLSWLILFMMFSATFMMFNTMNYYSFTTPAPKTQQPTTPYNKSMNWKW